MLYLDCVIPRWIGRIKPALQLSRIIVLLSHNMFVQGLTRLVPSHGATRAGTARRVGFVGVSKRMPEKPVMEMEERRAQEDGGEKPNSRSHVSFKVASPQAESHTAPQKLLLSGQWNSRKPSCMFCPLFWPTERSSCGSASVHVLDMHLTPHHLASLALAFQASRRVVGMQLRHSIKRRGVSYRYFLMVELSSGSNHYYV